MNEWLKEHQTLDTDKTRYNERFGKEIFNELFEKVWLKNDDTKSYKNILTAFGLNSNTKEAHLWLLLNRDKWEVAKDELFYICIPEPDGLDVYFIKGGGFQCSSKPPYKERYKWTQEEIDKHEVAKHLEYFKKKVEE